MPVTFNLITYLTLESKIRFFKRYCKLNNLVLYIHRLLPSKYVQFLRKQKCDNEKNRSFMLFIQQILNQHLIYARIMLSIGI